MKPPKISLILILTFFFSYSGLLKGQASLITDANWEKMHETISIINIVPEGKRYIMDMDEEGGRGLTKPVDLEAKIKVSELSAREHMVHYSPRTQSAEEYDFFLNMSMEYEVIESAPVFLQSDDVLSYWHIKNYETGKIGALYSRERLDLSQKGRFKINIPIYKAFKHIEKGTNIITRHHYYAIYNLNTGAKIDYTKVHSAWDRPWELTDYKTGDIAFYPDLLFVIADLSSFIVSFEDFQFLWNKTSPLRVKVAITDAKGEKFYLPRAEIEAEITGTEKTEKITLLPEMFTGAIPKYYFGNFIPEDITPEKVRLTARINYINPEGKSEVQVITKDYTEKDNLPLLNAVVQAPAKERKEIRAMFQHSPWVAGKEKIDETIGNMKKANLNLLLGQSLDDGAAIWKSKIAPTYQENIVLDSLKYVVETAHKNNIEVHPSIDVYRYPRPEPEWHKGQKRNFRQSVTANGVKRRICPYDVNYQDYLCEVIKELCENYDIDGINLDGIRTLSGCFCEVCKKTYQEKHGHSMLDDYQNYYPYPKRFTDWQEQGITMLVRKVHNTVKKIRPDIKISNCAYIPSAPSERDFTIQGQITSVWLQENLIDFTLPMIYSHSIWQSIIIAKDYLLNAPSPEQVVPFISLLEDFPVPSRAVRTFFARRPELVLAQIEAARREGFTNIGFYFGAWLVEEHIDALSNGPFREKSVPYWVK